MRPNLASFYTGVCLACRRITPSGTGTCWKQATQTWWSFTTGSTAALGWILSLSPAVDQSSREWSRIPSCISVCLRYSLQWRRPLLVSGTTTSLRCFVRNFSAQPTGLTCSLKQEQSVSPLCGSLGGVGTTAGPWPLLSPTTLPLLPSRRGPDLQTPRGMVQLSQQSALELEQC